MTHKIKELQKSETPVKKEEHKEVSKSPSIHPSITSSVSQFKDNSSFVSTSQSINNLSPSQSFSTTSKRINSKSTNTLQSLLNQNCLTFSSSISYKLNVDYNGKNKPQLDLFLIFPNELENKCLYAVPKSTPLFIVIVLLFQTMGVISYSFKQLTKINIIPLFIILNLICLTFYRFWLYKHITYNPETKRIFQVLFFFNQSFILTEGILLYNIKPISITGIHVGFLFLNFIFDSSFEFGISLRCECSYR